ncbi:MAG TPA: isopentenyl transferase family protein [Ktedonobacteraceae bacterium]|jgi:2-phosphoglycerate kinase|nr:isopentenyl transferase family protein [Ktedonobacteraceae bacterium]
MQQPQRDLPDWRVLLIGGSSGVGKTMVAQAIARRLNRSILLADDIRMAIQQVTTPAEQPGIHYFLAHPTIWQKPPEALCDGFITVGKAMMRPLSVAIAHHVFVQSAGPVIIEGDSILPALAARRDFSNIHFTPAQVTTEVRSVFIIESDEKVLLNNIHMQGRGFGKNSIKEQETFASACWLYGHWLRRQADHYNLPVVEARPRETLVERVLQIIEQSPLPPLSPE